MRFAASTLVLWGVAGMAACQPLAFTYADPKPGEETDAPTRPPYPDDRAPPSTDASMQVDVVTPTGLDFGDVGCGTSPPPKTIEVRNASDASIEIDAVVADALVVSVAPAHASVAAGGSVTLMVSTAVPRDARPAEESTSVTITTNAPGDAPHVLGARRGIVGAIFTSARSGVIDFYAVSGTKSTSFDVRNDGNLAAMLTLDVGDSDTFSAGPATLPIAAGAAGKVHVSASPPNGGATARQGTLRFSSDSIVCGSVPAPIDLRCRRND